MIAQSRTQSPETEAHYFGLVSLTTPDSDGVVLSYEQKGYLVNVALVFPGSSYPAQDCRSGVPWFL